MFKLAFMSLCAIFLALPGALTVFAQDQKITILYVRTDYNRAGNLCEDGSMSCPFNTIKEARDQGYKICAGRTFEVHLWNASSGEYEYYSTASGKKPVLPMGSPIAAGLLIVLITMVGAISLLIALRWQRKIVT